MALTQHPIAADFPRPTDEEFQALLNDIKQNGQQEPILVFQKKVLDGWSRYRACRELKITPKMKEYDGIVPPEVLVDSFNLHRRHLTPAQRAAYAVKRAPLYEAEAQRRAEAGRKKGSETARARRLGQTSVNGSLPKEQPRKKLALTEAARAYKAGINAVAELRSIQKANPEVFELAEKGKINVAQAKRISEFPSQAKTEAVKEIVEGRKATDVIKVIEANQSAAEQGLKLAVKVAESAAALKGQVERLLAFYAEKQVQPKGPTLGALVTSKKDLEKAAALLYETTRLP